MTDDLKTLEQMAEEYLRHENDSYYWAKHAFLAGYQAAKDTYKEAISVYQDVAKQMLEEAVRIMSPKDQLADADKVMNSPKKLDGWISVKERLPEPLESVLIVYAPTNESKNDYRMECWNWPETEVYETKFITHWMPLPAPPFFEEIK